MPALKPLALGDATRLRKGAFLLALDSHFNAAGDGRPLAGVGQISCRTSPADWNRSPKT